MLYNFKSHCVFAHDHLLDLNEIEEKAVDLLRTLRRTKASLNTCELIMEWHLRSIGQLNPGESLSESFEYISRKAIFKSLRERYNMPRDRYTQITKITLPYSRERVKIVWNHAENVLQSLLTDPRIRDEDYLFFNDDPFCPPPDTLDYIEDLNSGEAYVQTYRQLITNPEKQILLPVLFYIDAANTGQFADLPVTAVKISLGIFNRKARDKPHFWKILGYIPKPLKHKAKGVSLARKSKHLEGLLLEDESDDDEIFTAASGACKAQDLHTMLSVVLTEYL